jgi:hypothetical protein
VTEGTIKKWLFFINIVNLTAQSYEIGQIWKYRARDGEADSQIVIINSVRAINDTVVYSICVEGVKLKNPWIQGGIQTTLPHAPVSQEVLDLSVLELIGIRQNPLDEYETEFQEWKEPFDRHEAGVYTITVAEILDITEQAVNKIAIDYPE